MLYIKGVSTYLTTIERKKIMARTPSNMLDLGTKAPDFQLPNTIKPQTVNFEDAKGAKGTLVMFICNHCPYVIHVMEEVVEIAKRYEDQGIGFVAISSNDIVNYPADAPDKMTLFAQEYGFDFPYLYDESQKIAKAYDAACTPDFYLFDENAMLVYRGRLDESRPGNQVPVTGEDLKGAIDALIDGATIAEKQYPSMGCNIKWKN